MAAYAMQSSGQVSARELAFEEHGPYDASLTNKTVTTERDYNRVSRAGTPQVPSNDRVPRDDRLAAKRDVLRSRDVRSARDLIPGILRDYSVSE